MVENQGMIHSEAKFLSSCEPAKADKLSVPKTQWWDRLRIGTPILKGRNWKEEEDHKS